MSTNLLDIPDIFYSSETGAPMQHCKVCNKYLLDEGVQYSIEKAFVNYPGMGTRDLIWEFAMCNECMESTMQEVSEESQAKMNDYFAQNSDLYPHKQLLEEENFDPDVWLESCIVKGKKMSECSQFQIAGQCFGDKMIFEHTPFMISGLAMDEVAELLSNKTIGFMNDFRDKHFPPPEDLSPLLRDKDFVFI